MQKPIERQEVQFAIPEIQSMAPSAPSYDNPQQGLAVDNGASLETPSDMYDQMARAYFHQQQQYPDFTQGNKGIYTPDFSNMSEDSAKFLQHLGKTESGNNYYTGKNASGYEGKYQFRYRDAGDAGMMYANKMGVSPDQIRKSPELQEKMMQMALGDYDRELAGRGIAVNNYSRWLRHNQGLGGASAIMKGSLTPIIRRNLRNQGVNGVNDAELIAAYHNKFKPKFS